MNRTAYVLLAVTAALMALAVAPVSAARAGATKAQVVTGEDDRVQIRVLDQSSASRQGDLPPPQQGKARTRSENRPQDQRAGQPGKTGVLVVTLKKGRYPYLCTVPGHAAAGMKGVLTVR